MQSVEIQLLPDGQVSIESGIDAPSAGLRVVGPTLLRRIADPVPPIGGRERHHRTCNGEHLQADNPEQVPGRPEASLAGLGI